MNSRVKYFYLVTYSRYTYLFIYPQVSHITLYSDTCGGQNKNTHLVAMFMAVLKNHPTLKTVDHKFLLAGHTRMECDSDNALIEKNKKKN